MKRLLACVILVLGGCGDDGGGGQDGGGDDDDDDDDLVDAGGDVDGGECPAPAVIVYLNRNGGTFHAAEIDADDPVTDTSQMVNGADVELAPYAGSDEDWAGIVACVAAHYAPYDIAITDVDPGDVDQLEVVVTDDNSTGIIDQPGILSIASTPAAQDCNGVIEPKIGFVFDGVIGGITDELCQQASWLVGIELELDTTLACEDVMTWMSGCGEKSFTDEDSPCGEFEARACRCDPEATTQNSHQALIATLGAACE